MQELMEALDVAQIIEDYPDDTRLPKRTVAGIHTQNTSPSRSGCTGQEGTVYHCDGV